MTYIQRSIINPSEPFVSIIAQNLIRHTILIWNILFSFLLIPAGILIASLFSNELWLLDDPYFIPLGSMLVILCSAYWIMTLFLLRLYGQSLHKGFMLLNFIPILNSFFSMYLLNGPKEQFTHPFEVLRHTRTLENVLAILYVIFVLLISVIAIIMPIG